MSPIKRDSNSLDKEDFLMLLKEFIKLFDVPKGLPPVFSYDHSIPLQPGVGPINVWPYNDQTYQKAEILKLVVEML